MGQACFFTQHKPHHGCVREKKVPLKNVKESLKKRTQMDKKRKNSPLVKVKDAMLIRTDLLSKKQVLIKMSNHIKKVIY